MRICPGLDVPQARDGLDQLALPVGVDAGQADDLAGPHLQVEAAHGGQAAVVDHVQVSHLEHRLARRVLGLVDPQQHVATDHQRGQAALGGALGRHRVDPLAAPQDGHAVGDVEHLVELVRDEDDRRPARRQRAQHLEQVLRLLRGEHGGRLVEHQHLGAAEQRAEDLHALLGADAEVLDLGLRADREPVLLAQLPRPAHRLLVVEQRTARGLGPQHQVLGHGHDRDEHEVLVDHADAQPDRLPRGVDRDRLAVEQDLALVRVVEPVEDVHQRRLAGPVLPEQRMDLAALELEVDRVVRDQRAEALRDPAQLEGGCVAGHRRDLLRFGYLTSAGMSVISPSMICCLISSI